MKQLFELIAKVFGSIANLLIGNLAQITKFLHGIGVTTIVLTTAFIMYESDFVSGSTDRSWFSNGIRYLTGFEYKFYDYRMKPHMKKTPANKNIVLVEISDESIQTIGSWPLPRDSYAKVIDVLREGDARVVAFDVLFPEPTLSCGEDSKDDILARSIAEFTKKEGRNIVQAYAVQGFNGYFTPDEIEDPSLKFAPLDLLNSSITSHGLEACTPKIQISYVDAHTWPIQKFLTPDGEESDNYSVAGYLNMKQDIDGVFRNYQLYTPIYADLLEGYLLVTSLGLQAFLSAHDVNDFNMKYKDSFNCFAEMNIKNKTIEIDAQNQVKIRWNGGREKFDTIPLHKIIAGKNFVHEEHFENDKGEEYTRKIEVDLKTFFKDKIVYIASTATGAHDLRNTPIDSKLPGVYAHMNVTDMMQKQFFFKPINDSRLYSFIILGIGLAILIFTMLLNTALLDIFVLISLLCVTYALDYFYFLPQNYEIKLFYCYFAFVSTYLWITMLNFNQASAEKKQIKGAFSRYVAPSIVDDMLDNPDKLKVGGEKRDITCMFSDVRDFTSISEQLTATELAMALNRYMGEMTDIVFATNGTLDKYIGDAIVAFWGAPIDIGDHVNQAVDAGVKMLEALPAINEEFKAKNLPEFKIGLGLNSGECSVGNMGSDQIFAYTALGDNMNLGARLESLCKYYGAQILISEYTHDRLDHKRFTTRLIDNVIVKGKTEPVGVFEVLYSYHKFMIDKEALEDFKQAFQLFREGSFQPAKDLFDALAKKYPDDKASNRMNETCQHWIDNPPAQGENFSVTTMKTKG